MNSKPIPFKYTYADLPEGFYQRLQEVKFFKPQLLKWNTQLSEELGLDQLNLNEVEKAQYFSGVKLQPKACPLAQAYSGHQFGNFNPNLGDGRALLLGELLDKNNKLRDIHLKGSGPTKFSRNGDGYAQIGAVIREYLVSENMHYLNIPTTRTLGLISTGEIVHRETPQAGAIQVRVAASHIRIGTFEHFVSRKDFESVKILANYAIDRHYPELPKTPEGYLELFKKIVQSQILLISKWLSVGFIHGVMNTDNTTISGETIDFGPCAFMEEYNPVAVFSSIDTQGRYAYGRQPSILKWNLSNLGYCFLSLVDADEKVASTKISSVINDFDKLFENQWIVDTGKKFGLTQASSNDVGIFQTFLNWMYENKCDYTLSFRFLSKCLVADNNQLALIKQNYKIDYNAKSLENWLIEWKAKVNSQGRALAEVIQLMNSVNPAYIARNHRVEAAIVAAAEQSDMSVFENLLLALQTPYVEKPHLEEYLQPAKENEKVEATFCNT